jgi:hypothetical protein
MSGLREPPRIVVVIELEGEPQVTAVAESAEDAARLRESLLQRPLASEIAEALEQSVPAIREAPK